MAYRYLLLLAAPLSLYAALNQSIRIDSGVVSGVPGNDASITAFKGIPYAAPPVGNFRWRPPESPAAWKDTRRADHFSADCSQAQTGPRGPWGSEYMSPSAMKGGSSEDCLYLNVWTAATNPHEKRPVIVWIHGGGFSSGSGCVPVYDGEGLAAKGVVMVTINYRLGVLGYLAHPDLTKESSHHASGNYGLLDIIAALQWVRNNIAAFGGDPNNVTTAGQSAGAFAINYLMASPLAKGLFHRAIAESGGAFIGTLSLPQAEAAGIKLAQSEGASTIAELRAKSADAVREGLGTMTRPVPIVDGYVVPSDVFSIFAEGRQNDVPLLLGWNSSDGVSFGAPPKAAAFREQARRNFGGLADAFLRVFPAATDKEAAASQHDLVRAQRFAWQDRTWARLQGQTGKSKVFLYYFDRVAPGTPSQTRWGAFHSGEIPYALNTLNRWDRPFETADRKLANQMSTYWVNFATTGDPNGPGLPEWPAYSTKDERSIKLAGEVQTIATPQKKQLDFFDTYSTSKRRAP
jgi:para-nitrobenzyl esterase